jgi:two-component system NtrC family response regulator
MTDEPARTLLVLDDEQDARELIRLILTPLGYTVYMAAEGEEAMALLEEIEIAVVLVDMLMPGMSGREFLEALASFPWERRPVPVVNSARRRREVEAELAGMDVFDIVVKPFELHDIEERIALAYEEKRRRMRS